MSLQSLKLLEPSQNYLWSVASVELLLYGQSSKQQLMAQIRLSLCIGWSEPLCLTKTGFLILSLYGLKLLM